LDITKPLDQIFAFSWVYGHDYKEKLITTTRRPKSKPKLKSKRKPKTKSKEEFTFRKKSKQVTFRKRTNICTGNNRYWRPYLKVV